jgi:hypothetical protein
VEVVHEAAVAEDGKQILFLKPIRPNSYLDHP